MSASGQSRAIDGNTDRARGSTIGTGGELVALDLALAAEFATELGSRGGFSRG